MGKVKDPSPVLSERTTTSIRIDPGLWQRVKLLAVVERKNACEVVEEALQAHLDHKDA